MVRFINDNKVLINYYPKINKQYAEFYNSLIACLWNAGLDFIELPYTSWENKDDNDATGCYINFLEVGNKIFCPVWKSHSDKIAMKVFQSVFNDREIIDIDCTELSKHGGVLNCATWNIKKPTL